MCTISISTVTGTTSAGVLTQVTVTGTASQCDQVTVSIRCAAGIATKTVGISAGSFTASFTSADGLGKAECDCGKNILVSVTCVGNPACQASWSGVLNCPDCPSVTLGASVGITCNQDGARTVTLTAYHPGTVSPTAYWDYGDTSGTGVPFALTGGVFHFDPHLYTPGTYTATLYVAGCPPVTITFTVSACPANPCPGVNVWATPDDECDASGMVDVALSAIHNGTVVLSGQWDFGDGNPGSTVTLSGGVGTTTHHNYPPGTYTATLYVTGCPSVSVTFTVPPCPTTTTTTTTTSTTTSTTTTSTTTTSTTTPPGDDDEGEGGCMGCMGCMPCSLLCIVWAVLLAGFLVGVATAAFASPQALGLAGAALVVLAVLYILYCGVCRWALCVLLGIAIFILAVVGMWVAGVAMPGLGGAALIALVFLLLALFIRWRYCR